VPERYRFQFAPGSTYQRVVGLLERWGPPAGVVVDLGCGYGAMAEPLRDRGYTYVGVDADPGSVEDLRARGFEADVLSLDPARELPAAVERISGSRPLAAVCLLDVLEHLSAGPDVLDVLRGATAAHPGAVLLMSVPNVAHVDLAAKLLMGRWDITPTGLLDETHIALYTESRLCDVVGRAGWVERGRDDLVMVRSDQHFPADAAALSATSPLGALVRDVRDRLPASTVNQFVRAYVPTVCVPEVCVPEVCVPGVHAAASPPMPERDRFLTVVVRTGAERPEMVADAMLSLLAQTSQDFDVVMCCGDAGGLTAARAALDALPGDLRARVEILAGAAPEGDGPEGDGGGRGQALNEAFSRGRGRYLAVLDHDDIAFAHWIETFATGAAATEGRLVRAMSASQAVRPERGQDQAGRGQAGRGQAGRGRSTAGYEPVDRPRSPWPSAFSLADHLQRNETYLSSWAFPRSCVEDLGLRFDETMAVGEDWHFAVRAALLCGVTDVAEVTSLHREWIPAPGLPEDHGAPGWDETRARLHADLRAAAWPVDGTTLVDLVASGRIDRRVGEQAAGDEHGALRGELDDARRALDETRASAAARDQELREARHEATMLRASSSWRVTAPLRWVSGRLQGSRPGR